MKRFTGCFIKVHRSNSAASQHLAEVVERGNEIAHRSSDIRFEVAASYHALFGIEIDQDQWPISERRNACYDWACELEHHGTCPNALQRQCLEAHPSPL